MTSAFGLRPLFATFIVCIFAVTPLRAEELPPVVAAMYKTLELYGGDTPKHDSLDVAGDGTITIKGFKGVMQNFQQDGEDVDQGDDRHRRPTPAFADEVHWVARRGAGKSVA